MTQVEYYKSFPHWLDCIRTKDINPLDLNACEQGYYEYMISQGYVPVEEV